MELPGACSAGNSLCFAAQEHRDWLATSRIFIVIIDHILISVKAAIPLNESFPYVFFFCVLLCGDYMPFLDMKKRLEKGLQNSLLKFQAFACFFAFITRLHTRILCSAARFSFRYIIIGYKDLTIIGYSF